MIVRAGNNELVRLDVLVEHKLSGIRTFDPQILRRLAAQNIADLRPHDVGEPVHGSLRIATSGDRFRYMAVRLTAGKPSPMACLHRNWAYSAACRAPRTP